MDRLLLLAALVVVLVAGWTTASSASPEPATSTSGFFTADQVARGRVSYAEKCDECHSLHEFRGDDFEWTWRRQTAWELFKAISSTMPENQPGGLELQTYADIVAYFLSLNDYQMGATELKPAREALSQIPLGAGAEKSRSTE